MQQIPQDFRDLFEDETRAFMSLATSMANDKSPQVTPVWFNHDDEYLLINSAKGRVKDENMRANPEVACLIMDPHDPYRYIQVMGTVEEIVEGEQANEHIRELNFKYHGNRDYPIGNQQRVIYKIRPQQISAKD